MLKVFISQPMNGLSEEEILEARNIAIDNAKRVLGDDIEILDSYFKDYDPEAEGFDKAATPIKYLAKSIDILADADVVYFAKGHRGAQGCLVEYYVAKGYGKRILRLED